MKSKFLMMTFLMLFALGGTTVIVFGQGDFNKDSSKHVKAQPKLPTGELGRVIELGREIVERTAEHPLSKPYVGNSLNCTSCHLENGTHDDAASFIGIATAYPAWSPREKRVITLQDRVLNCFMRSENGIRPPQGSEVSVAITTYITWLSTDQPVKQNPNFPLGPNHIQMLKAEDGTPDIKSGAVLYEERCAYCHGDMGAGTDDGPPVWGDQSYNNGAGLSRIPKLASWLKVGMPPDDPSLTSQEAFDIAAFVNSQPRPNFKQAEHLPPADKSGQYNSAVTK